MSLSDEEQLEQIKSFGKKYGSAMVSGILIALIAFFGWEYWQKKNLTETQNQTAKVQKLMDDVQATAGQANAFAAVSEAADKIVKHDANAVQAIQTQFILAKLAYDKQDYAAAEKALKTVEFYLLWLILFINISCGLALISVVSPMAQDVAGMTANQAAIIVGLMGIFDGFGRLLWASLSDYIGRPLTCTILFVVNILMTISLIFLHAPALFTIAMAVLMTCYGAGFSLIPPYLSDIFGAKELATHSKSSYY